MSAVETLLTSYIMPTAVIVSAAATTTTAVFAWRLYTAVKLHDRALFGEPEVEGHDGIIEQVEANEERSERHRLVLKRYDLMPSEDDFYRGGNRDADEDGA